MSEIERNIATTKDGYIVDADTGEVIGIAEIENTPQRFEVNDRASAEWVLSKIVEHESNIVGIEARKKAIVANLDAQAKAEANRVNFLHFKFDADLQEFADKQLAGSKVQTLRLDNGTLSFKMSTGSLNILDEVEAIEWLKRAELQEAVKVKETVLKSNIPKGIELPAELFERVPPARRFYVKTGVVAED